MALTLVQNKICAACGAEIRPNALFCYACGGAVAEEKPDEILSNGKAVQAVAEKSETVEKTVINEIVETKEIEQPKEIEKPVVEGETKLKTAAAMRRKSKSFQNKRVEVVWEEHDSAPNLWFMAVAFLLAIVSGVILFLAFYLK